MPHPYDARRLPLYFPTRRSSDLLPVTLLAEVKTMLCALRAVSSKFVAPVILVAALAVSKPEYARPLAPVPAFVPVRPKLVVPVMSPPLVVFAALKPE